MPISAEVVDDAIIRSCKLGGNSRKRRRKWCGGDRFIPQGPTGSGSF
jgi:hypothetical protein